jgi:hypothetical protein
MSSKSLKRLSACLGCSLILGFGLANRSAFVQGRNHSYENNETASATQQTASAKPGILGLVMTGHGVPSFDTGVTSSPVSAGISPQQGAPAEKTADQARKNVQVLKGLPDAQLIPVMNYMSASLGVSCAFCHVNAGGDKWEFEKDDKPEKAAARRMIQMTMDLNKQYFNGRHSITCFSCHRGAEHPVGTPPVVLSLVTQATAPEAKRPLKEPLPTVDEVIAKYIAALGGQAAIEGQKSRVLKGVQTGSNGASVPIEIYETAPNKYAAVVKNPKGGDFRTTFDGTTGWLDGPRGRQDLTGDDLEMLKRAASFYSFLKMPELYPKMRVAGQDKIGDRTVYVVMSQPSERLSARLYFDTQTGLLLRVLNLSDTMIGRIPQQTDYEDYRDVNGLKMPFVIRQSYVDARSGSVRTFSEIKANLPVDESKFSASKSRS